jgi:type VI secretion system protein ImpK
MPATTAPHSGKLVDVFSDLFVLGSYFRDARDLGTVEALRSRLHYLFQEVEERGKAAGVPRDTLTEARYALAAFIDEMIINSRWSHKEQWSARPLQYELFGEFVAGEGFFKHLEAIRSAMPLNTDLLETYALCLILGFEGQYKVHDREKLRGLVEDVTREVQAKRGELPPLSPHGQRPEELLDAVKRQVPVWVVLVISLGIVFFFYLALSVLISHDAGTVMEELKRLLQEVPS